MEKTERFLLEMHMHTRETSSCGEVPAAEGGPSLQGGGLSGGHDYGPLPQAVF